MCAPRSGRDPLQDERRRAVPRRELLPLCGPRAERSGDSRKRGGTNMNAPATSAERIDAAIAALGPGSLTEKALQRHVAPLFSRHKLAYGDRIYLANHSLGRPLDATGDDIR